MISLLLTSINLLAIVAILVSPSIVIIGALLSCKRCCKVSPIINSLFHEFNFQKKTPPIKTINNDIVKTNPYITDASIPHGQQQNGDNEPMRKRQRNLDKPDTGTFAI